MERGASLSELSAPPCVCPAWARCDGVKVPCFMNSNKERKLDYGNCGVALRRVSGRAGSPVNAGSLGDLQIRGQGPAIVFDH